MGKMPRSSIISWKDHVSKRIVILLARNTWGSVITCLSYGELKVHEVHVKSLDLYASVYLKSIIRLYVLKNINGTLRKGSNDLLFPQIGLILAAMFYLHYAH